MKPTRLHGWRAVPALAVFVAAWLAWPSAASAHLVSSGAGPFYDGVAHFFVSVEDLMVVVGLALFGGLAGRRSAAAVAVATPSAWLAGLVAGRLLDGPTALPVATAVGLMAAGLLAAAAPSARWPVAAAVAVGLAGLHGVLNGGAIAETGTAWLAAAGIVSAAAVLGLLVAAVTASRDGGWQRIAARALGSWVAAVGLLTLAWQFRPDGGTP